MYTYFLQTSDGKCNVNNAIPEQFGTMGHLIMPLSDPTQSGLVLHDLIGLAKSYL